MRLSSSCLLWKKWLPVTADDDVDHLCYPSLSPPSILRSKLGIVSGWRSNEWISQDCAIHYLLHSGSEWLATDLKTHMLQRTSRQEQGPACQSNCQGKHKAEKTAGPLFPYAARCMPRMRSHMLIELYMIHWRGRRREERIGVWLEEKLCAGFYAAPIQM